MMENSTAVTMLTLSGLNYAFEFKLIIFFVTLLWYLVILLGNITVIVVIVVNKSLHEPMYIFLCNYCANALYATVGFYPKFLLDLLLTNVISLAACFVQGFVIHSAVCSDYSMLALMAYDRYVAICHPLTYNSVMTKQRICVCVFLTWLVPLLCMFMNTATVLGSRLCGSHITKIYCSNVMIVKLACSPPRGHNEVTYFNVTFFFLHFLFIAWTYIQLIRTCLTSAENQRKFMQTCMPHLISLLTFSLSVLLEVFFVRFGSMNISVHLNNFMSMEFLLVPPAANPFIYGFKLRKIRNKIVNLVWIERKNVHIETPSS